MPVTIQVGHRLMGFRTKKTTAVVVVAEVGAVDNTTPNKKSLFLKIGIIVAIVGVIVGIVGAIVICSIDIRDFEE